MINDEEIFPKETKLLILRKLRRAYRLSLFFYFLPTYKIGRLFGTELGICRTLFVMLNRKRSFKRIRHVKIYIERDLGLKKPLDSCSYSGFWWDPVCDANSSSQKCELLYLRLDCINEAIKKLKQN